MGAGVSGSGSIFVEGWDEAVGLEEAGLKERQRLVNEVEDESKAKPMLKDARVFYLDVGALPPSDIRTYIENWKKELSKEFDISGVVFMPVRGSEDVSGWKDRFR